MEAVIYSNGNQECERAKTLLENLNFQISVYKLNQHFSQKVLLLNLVRRQNTHKLMLVSDILVD